LLHSASNRAQRASTPTRLVPKHRPTVTVIIPTMNEAANLPHVLPRLPDSITEVIIVDAHSKDETVEVARALRPDARILMQVGRGKGAALRQGFAAATGEIIVSIDADGSTMPEEIPTFVDALMAGADYVKGSRYVPGGGSADLTLLRKMGNRGLTMMVRVVHGARFSDLCYGFNAFWRDVLPILDLQSTGFEIETEMNLRAHVVGLRVIEVPSVEAARIYGQSNLRTFPDGWRVFKQILLQERRRAARQASPATTATTWVAVPMAMPEQVAVPIDVDGVDAVTDRELAGVV
jgi:glycosyltransferase involved in cell wall biosynthesis